MTLHRRSILLILIVGMTASASPAHSQDSRCLWDRYCGCPGDDAAAETAEQAKARIESVAKVLRRVMDPEARARVSKTAQRRIGREFADEATREHLLCFLEVRGLLTREAALKAVEKLAVDESDGRTYFWDPVGTAGFHSPPSQSPPYQISGGPLVHGRRFGVTKDPAASAPRPWMRVMIEAREYTLHSGEDDIHKASRWSYHLCGNQIRHPALSIPPPSGKLIIHRCPRAENCDWETPNPCR